MQISGANMLLASQQAAPAAKSAAPGFVGVLQKAAGFTPQDLTKPENTPAAAPQAETKPAQAGAMRPGLHIDLKV